MNKNTRVNLPLSFSVADFDSERFLKLRVKVMHSGLNLNGSTFDTQAIEKAESSIANIPLLAFTKQEDGEGVADFTGHEFEIRISENGMKYVYLGRPVGIVPETNNYSVEMDEETGKTFVYVDAYVWKDYANSALDIIERDGEKKVSMEIRVNDYIVENSTMNITDYNYTGIALLGDDVQEAMIGAKAEIAEFSQTKEGLASIFTALKEELESAEVELEKEMTADSKPEMTTDSEQEDDFSVESEDSVPVEPELTPEEMNAKNTESIPEPLVEPAKPQDEDFETKIADLEARIATLTEANNQLETEKSSLENKLNEFQVQSVLKDFEDLAEMEEFSAIKENATNTNAEDLKLQLFALRGQKVTVNPVQKLVYNFVGAEGSDSNEPSWAGLVKQRKK